MSNEEAIANLVGLMTSFHLEIKALPDDLKCANCKSVLKNACQMPCDCRFCRACIDDVIARGVQFCPGVLHECGGSPLWTALPDYWADESVLKLNAKCPNAGCSCECSLADLEGHMSSCSSKNIDYPFVELECAQGALTGEETSSHLLQESQNQGEILIGTVADISMDMDMLKRERILKDEPGKHLENDMKSFINENKSIKNEIKIENELIKDENKSFNDEIKLINFVNKSIKEENKSIKEENKSIKEENKSINEENKSIKEENKTIKIENELIKREKEVLCDRVRELSEKLEREIDENHQIDGRDIVMLTAVTEAEISNRDETEPVRDDIQSMKEQLDCMKCREESIRVVVGLGKLDDWLIEEDVAKTEWRWRNDETSKVSSKFGGGEHPYAFELSSWNSVRWGELEIWLRIWAGPSDPLLQWPFSGKVTVTVAHRDIHGSCIRQTRQCRIERPADNQYRCSDKFKFSHAALREAGLNLERGVRVSCRIVPCVS